MNTPMERIRALLAAGEKATQGEWEHAQEYDGGRSVVAAMRSLNEVWAVNVKRGYDGPLPAVNTRSNGDFIAQAANARPDLALLVKLVDAVRERRDAEAEMDDSVFWQAASDRLRLAIERANAILAELEAQ